MTGPQLHAVPLISSLPDLFSILPSLAGTSGTPSQSQSPWQNPQQRTQTSNPAPLTLGPPQAGNPQQNRPGRPHPAACGAARTEGGVKTPGHPGNSPWDTSKPLGTPQNPRSPNMAGPPRGRPEAQRPLTAPKKPAPPLPRVRTQLRAGPRPPERSLGGGEGGPAGPIGAATHLPWLGRGGGWRRKIGRAHV